MKKLIKNSWPIVAIFLFGLLVWVNIYLSVVEEVKAEPLDTYHSSWHVIRADAAEDAANFAAGLALATNEGNFANKPSGAFHIVPKAVGARGEGYSYGSKWMFAICGDPNIDDTFSFNLIGWGKINGMAQVICEGNGILGTQDVVIQPDGTADPNGFWADTIALDEMTKWPGVTDANGAITHAGVSVYNSGDNEVALLVVETTGLEWIQFIVYDVAGGAECSTVAVYGRRY